MTPSLHRFLRNSRKTDSVAAGSVGAFITGGGPQPAVALLWRYPEWWTVLLCGAAWVTLLAAGWQHSGHRMPVMMELWHWMLMVMAMMVPFTLDRVRVAAEASLWARRNRAIAGFLAGYLAPWLGVGVLAAWMRQASWTQSYAVPAALFGLAAVWMVTPLHTRALAGCHRRCPLAPVGWRADRDCLRFGGTIGIACVASCWPLMLACAFTGHSVIAMAGGMAVSALERWPYRPREREAWQATAALAGIYVVLAVLPPVTAFAEQASKPMIAAVTSTPFTLGATATHILLSTSKDSVLRHINHRPEKRYFLGIENLRSGVDSPAFAVYLNLPPDGDIAKSSQLFAGHMPLFGVREATRGKAGVPGTGLTYRFDVTDVLRRLASQPKWDPARLRVSFIPERWEGKAEVRVGQVVLVESVPGGR